MDAKVQGGSTVYWNTGGYASWDPFYVTYQNPTGWQSVPWTETLGLSCYWGLFKDTAADVCHDETFGLYWGGVFAYDLGDPTVGSNWVVDHPGHDDDGLFKLWDLYNDLSNYGIQSGNCVDVSDFLHLILASQGISSDLQQLFYSHGSPAVVGDPYITQRACPIGSNGSDTSLYYHFVFTMHQQAVPSTGTCDAALAYLVDLSGSTLLNPAANWSMPDYWQKVSGPTIYGHAYRDLKGTDSIYSLTSPLPPWTVVAPDTNYGPAPIGHDTNTYGLPGIK